MVTASELKTDVKGILENGEQVRFRYFNPSGANSGFDDDVALTKSGTDVYTSGLYFPIKNQGGAVNNFLGEQGKITNADMRLFVVGDINVSGIWKVGLGSPQGREFAQIENGVRSYDIEGQSVYKEIYLRHLTTGSLVGE